MARSWKRATGRLALLGTICLALGGQTACLPFLGRAPGPEAPPVFYPPLPEQPRIQYLESYSSERELTQEAGAFQRFILGEPRYGEIGKPYGIALHDRKLFLCDTAANVVAIYDLETKTKELLGAAPPGRLQKPINVVIDEDGRRYVADTKLGRVLVYDADNRYLSAFGNPDSWSPSDVAVAGPLLYVVDVRNGRIAVLDRETGNELKRFGGRGPDRLVKPTNIELDDAGNLYVADTGRARVLKFDSEGNQIRQFGSLGDAVGRFVRPKGVAIDREGRVYVVDAAFENVQVFDPEGKLLLFFGSGGSSPGSMNLPAKVTIDYQAVDLFADRVAPGYELAYLILVSNQYGRDKVNVYGFLKPAAALSQSRAE